MNRLALTSFMVFLAAAGGAIAAVSVRDALPTDPLPVAAAANPCPLPEVQSIRSLSQREPNRLKGRAPRADPRRVVREALWEHRAAQHRLTALRSLAPRVTADVGDVAVLQDEGDMVVPANFFDLQLKGLRYVPNAASAYDVVPIESSFRVALGEHLQMNDDDSAARSLAFGFRFFGVTKSAAFVNSDGNITFDEGDRSTAPRDIDRLVSGAPRMAPFLADLDPSVGGSIFVRAATDVFTVTWCSVPVWHSSKKATMQVSLLPNGTIEMMYADTVSWSATDGVVGLSPGHAEVFHAVDLSTTTAPAIDGGAGALGERFSARPDLDLVAAARKFYQSHDDVYDQLVIWTDMILTPENAFSFEVTVANDVLGIGLRRYDSTSEFGSNGGRLRSLVQMDAVWKFPDDASRKFAGENSTLSILGQEVGHRWLAFVHFSDHNREPSNALLGRDNAHWSFFFNSDASVMEGNRIQDLGGGQFRTIAAVEKYSLLDQYAMGLVREADVPPLFYVENPANVAGDLDAGSPPRVGVTFNGTRRDVRINDIVEVMGRRQPSVEDSPKVFRQAFLFLVGPGRVADSATVAKVDRIRRAWEPFFAKATDNRGRVETRLRGPG